MTATYIHDGATVDFTPAEALPTGSVVVVEDLVGVTKRTLFGGELGSLHLTGVFEFPKQTGAGKAIPFGKKVYWHPTAGEVRDAATGGAKFMGYSVQPTEDNTPRIRVRLGGAA